MMGTAKRPSIRMIRGAIVSSVTTLAALMLYLMPSAGAAAGRPLITVEPGAPGRSKITFGYSVEKMRSELVMESSSRRVVEGTAGHELRNGLGVWAYAKASGGWTESADAWTVTDLEFGPSGALRGLAGRLDVDGWFTLAARAGKTPGEDVCYGGVNAWSYGAGARASANVLGAGGSSHLAVAFDLRYRSQARSDFIYLPHHSVALANTAGASSGSVLVWQARLELRSDRAGLATILLREEPLGAGEVFSGTEKPLYLIQSAGVRAWRGIGIFANGELLLSSDDKDTAYEPRSVLPAWGFSVGLAWELGL